MLFSYLDACNTNRCYIGIITNLLPFLDKKRDVTSVLTYCVIYKPDVLDGSIGTVCPVLPRVFKFLICSRSIAPSIFISGELCTEDSYGVKILAPY